MSLLKRRKDKPGTLRGASSADHDHLVDFVGTRSGIEAYLEPRTAVTDTTIVLVAADGEWTRRRVDGPDGAASFAKKHKLPLYDAGLVGYPNACASGPDATVDPRRQFGSSANRCAAAMIERTPAPVPPFGV